MIFVYITLLTLLLLCAVIMVNTIKNRPEKEKTGDPDAIVLDADKLARNLSGMIKIRTITADKMENFDKEAFLGMHKFLEKTYPLIHSTLTKEIVNEFSLLYKWAGTGSQKKPFLLMAHMDVVPVDERTADKWKHDAFSGQITEGYVWGRGALDMKGHLTAVMESVEYLLRQGYRPKRDIYIAFGHDEERMGLLGARNIVELLKQKGIRFDFVIDEGGTIIDKKEIGLKTRAAMIGICEKGYADIKLTAESAGGHASRPPKKNAVGELAKAIVKLEKNKIKPTLNKPLKSMLKTVAGYMEFPMNVIASNLFILKALLFKVFSSDNMGNAFISSTIVPTVLRGAILNNVLPEKAEAVINCRISPDNSVKSLVEHIKKVIGKDIKVEILYSHEPTAVSSIKSEAYCNIAKTAAEIFKGFIIAPYPMVAATDSRWFAAVSDDVYRVLPFCATKEDGRTVHAANERLKVESLYEGTAFYIRLIKRADL